MVFSVFEEVHREENTALYLSPFKLRHGFSIHQLISRSIHCIASILSSILSGHLQLPKLSARKPLQLEYIRLHHTPPKVPHSPIALTMASPATLVTLASDVLVISAAVGVAGVSLTSLGSQYRKMLPAAIKTSLGGTEGLLEEEGEEDGMT